MRYVVFDYVVSNTHPYLAKDGVLFAIRDTKTGRIGMARFTSRQRAEEIASKLNSDRTRLFV